MWASGAVRIEVVNQSKAGKEKYLLTAYWG